VSLDGWTRRVERVDKPRHVPMGWVVMFTRVMRHDMEDIWAV